MDRNDLLKTFIENGRALKELYSGLLYPFFDEKKIRFWRNCLYQLNYEEYIIDRLWEYLNGDIELEDLILVYAKYKQINDKRL